MEHWDWFMERAFGGDAPDHRITMLQIAARTVVVFLGGLALVRWGKSRLISRATPLDVILGFILGSLLSRGITGHAAISDTLVASAVLIGLHWALTGLACYSPRFESWIKGHSYVLVEHGEVRRANMMQSHVSECDLAEALRLQGLTELAQVRLAFKERNGEMSIIKAKTAVSGDADSVRHPPTDG